MMMIYLKNFCPTKVCKELFLLINIAKGPHHRISHARCSVRKGVLKISQNSQGNVADLRRATLLKLKNRLWCKCFPVNFLTSLRTSFLQSTSV